MEVKDSVALITGGASGLGAACAEMVIACGGRAVIADLDEERGAVLAERLGARCRFVRADVTSAEEVSSAVSEARSAFGALDIAVSCAGIVDAARVIGKEGPVDLERFERVIRVNLIGTFNVTRLVAASMAGNDPDSEGERGIIVNTASVAAWDGQIGQTAYAASKGGVASMTLPLARDLARHGIRVVAVAPGVFETPMMAGMPEKVRAALVENVPFPQRLGRPSEFAMLVEHIIDNPMLNGEVIRLDGALRMPPR